MNITIKPSKISGKIQSICSKSVAHRMLICASLCKETTLINKITNPGKDILATVSCLQSLGVNVEEKKAGYLVGKRSKIKAPSINCIESGSTLRFLLPIISALGIDAKIDGMDGLRKRPIKDLVDLLNDNGGDIEGTTLPLKVNGKLHNGVYKIKGNISSQYISGLLMALPLLENDSKIIIDGNCVSVSYIDITVAVMEMFGVFVKKTNNGFNIKGNQNYTSPDNINVEGDWSNSCFWLVNGAINCDTTVSGLSLKSKQGDKEIIDILKKMGANIIIDKDSITVRKSNLIGIDCSIENIPDSALILSIAMASAKGISTLSGVNRLKIKESDRLSAIIEILTDMGIDCCLQEDKLIINGGQIKGCKIDCRNDHRVVMAGAIAGGIAKGETLLIGTDAVKKSYPNFFEDYKILGGAISD